MLFVPLPCLNAAPPSTKGSQCGFHFFCPGCHCELPKVTPPTDPLPPDPLRRDRSQPPVSSTCLTCLSTVVEKSRFIMVRVVGVWVFSLLASPSVLILFVFRVAPYFRAPLNLLCDLNESSPSISTPTCRHSRCLQIYITAHLSNYCMPTLRC